MPNTLPVQIELPPAVAETFARWLQGRADYTVNQHWNEPRYVRIEDTAKRRVAILRRFPSMFAAHQTAAQIRAQLSNQEAAQ
ncbi:hypothetical protein [Pseudomonas sp. JBR1]|uniref:hypothetical protein n=1 Tax=Pseudomonas sp. JBR1 TaxID=3020907 RepID=UPI0023061AFA|nr:hypothetical protein [Pseudomonas sp. JBR1]WCE09508.1 hypothetical protein PJ259_04470 [Pseudomonas sp. JBR1]